MRAVGITEPGGPEVLRVVDRPEPTPPGPGEVRIAVAAAAVNPTDVTFRQMGFPDLPPPWTPGMDAAGTVEAVGAGVERLAVGDQVMAGVLPIRPEGGAQAERIVVPEASAVPIPEGASLALAATLPMNGLTALRGLEQLGLEPGQTLAVTGAAGHLGGLVIALAKEQGLEVVADAKPDDEQRVRDAGADVVVERGDGFADAVRAATDGRGADGLFDIALLHEAVFGAIRDGGAMVVVRGWKPEAPPPRDIEVHRVWVRFVLERTDWLLQLRALASKGVLPLEVARELPPEEAAEAHRLMDAGGLRGRVVLVF